MVRDTEISMSKGKFALLILGIITVSLVATNWNTVVDWIVPDSQESDVPETPVETPLLTYMGMSFTNYNGTVMDGNGVHDEASAYIYGKVVDDWSTWTDADYDALDPNTDFTLLRDLQHGENLTWDDDYIYYGIANCTGFGSISFRPIRGLNQISLVATPDASNILCYSANLSTTVNETDEINWNGILSFVNSDLEVDEDLGYKPHVDSSQCVRMDEWDDAKIYNVLVFDFNSTSLDRTDVKLAGLTVVDTIIDGDEIQFFIDEVLTGNTAFSFTLDVDEIGVTWELTSVAFKTGIYGDTLTQIAITA